jgi:hypothetical protein
VSIPSGAAITWSCTYDNTTGRTISFGELVSGNEECALAGIIYPTNTSAHQGEGIDSLL